MLKGFGNETLAMTTKQKAIQCVLHHQVFKFRRDQIEDLKRGMDSLMVLWLMNINEQCISSVFPLSTETIVTSADVLQAITSEDEELLSHQQLEVLVWFKQYVLLLDKGTYYASIVIC